MRNLCTRSVVFESLLEAAAQFCWRENVSALKRDVVYEVLPTEFRILSENQVLPLIKDRVNTILVADLVFVGKLALIFLQNPAGRLEPFHQ